MKYLLEIIFAVVTLLMGLVLYFNIGTKYINKLDYNI